MKISWNWGVKDSTVVCALLSMNLQLNVYLLNLNYEYDLNAYFVADEIYDCEKTFERLFLGAIFGTNAPYFIAGWRSDFKDQVFKIQYRY